MSPLYYFAYGSNLHPRRLRLRTPGARPLGRANLRGYRLRLHKLGQDKSAKCDVCYTGRRDDLVHGAVYRLPRRDRIALDRAEDLGRGYRRVRLHVNLRGRRRMVFTYVALPEAIADGLAPFDWYLAYVLRGARYHGLPGGYVRRLRGGKAVRDDDAARRLHHRGVTLSGAPPYRRR
jgi:gamma-glutamylcyclotransferase